MPSPDVKNAALVFTCFVSLHLLLLLGTFDIYDLEETEYGNVAAAVLDGHVAEAGYLDLTTREAHGQDAMTAAGRRRRTVWSVEPSVVPFFAVLGPSMLALKLWALVGAGIWAAVWFLLARRVAPRAPPWVPALLLILPIPLVQRAALSATSITAHLGSSAWHGLAMLLAVLALERRGEDGPRAVRVRGGLVLLSGLVAGFGLHCSFSLLPLLVGVVWLVFRAAPVAGVPLWAAGTLPTAAMLWRFRDPGRAELVGTEWIIRLTGLSDQSSLREGASWWSSLLDAGRYWPGFGRYELHEGASGIVYQAPPSLVYTALVVAVLAAGAFAGRGVARGGDGATAVTRDCRIACALSFGAFGVAFLRAGFNLDPSIFDGVRYMLPIAPLSALLLAWALGRLGDSFGRRGLVGGTAAIMAAHAVGFAFIFEVAVFPAPWGRLVGYEPVVMKAWMTDDLQPDSVADDRLERWAMWAGISDARGSTRAFRPRPAAPDGLEREGEAAYWRGVGIGRILDQPHGESLGWSLHEPEIGWILEGAAFGTTYHGCNDSLRRAMLAEAPSHASAIWYGIGRGDLYCVTYAGSRDEEVPPEHRADFERGLRDAWRLDYAVGGAELPAADDPRRPAVRLY